MSVSLTANFLQHSRGITFEDANGIAWGIDRNTNRITAAYSGSGSAGAANPAAKVGLTAVNGSAATFMRSDAAPPIDLTLSPTWTGSHTFAPGSGVAVVITGASATNAFRVTAAVGAIGTLDTTSTNGGYITWKTNGTAIGDIGAALGNLGFGSASDMAVAARGANSLYLSTNGANRVKIDGAGAVTVSGEFAINGGTPTSALSGFGSPSGSVTSSLSSSATLAEVAGTLAALLAYLKTIGVVAA